MLTYKFILTEVKYKQFIGLFFTLVNNCRRLHLCKKHLSVDYICWKWISVKTTAVVNSCSILLLDMFYSCQVSSGCVIAFALLSGYHWNERFCFDQSLHCSVPSCGTFDNFLLHDFSVCLLLMSYYVKDCLCLLHFGYG